MALGLYECLLDMGNLSGLSLFKIIPVLAQATPEQYHVTMNSSSSTPGMSRCLVFNRGGLFVYVSGQLNLHINGFKKQLIQRKKQPSVQIVVGRLIQSSP
jgi:hypothetical protein